MKYKVKINVSHYSFSVNFYVILCVGKLDLVFKMYLKTVLLLNIFFIRINNLNRLI